MFVFLSDIPWRKKIQNFSKEFQPPDIFSLSIYKEFLQLSVPNITRENKIPQMMLSTHTTSYKTAHDL